MVKTNRSLPCGIAAVRAPLPTGGWVIVSSVGLSREEVFAARIALAATGGTVVMTFAQLFALMADALL